MAAAVKAIAVPAARPVHHERHHALGVVLSAALPVATFVLADGIAELFGFVPLFFSPLGLPGWVGGALHIGTLPLFGIACWLVAGEGRRGRAAAYWLVALLAGLIAFPFVVAPLDSLALSMLAMALLLTGIAAMARVAAISRLAAFVMLPGIMWIGFSAFVGLSFVAAWSPPFGLTNSNSAS